jgi:hypothetical protein
MINTSIGGEAAYYQPPDPEPECSWCDGEQIVAVASVRGGDYKVFTLPNATKYDIEVACPYCDGSGVEPEPTPEDNPNVP